MFFMELSIGMLKTEWLFPMKWLKSFRDDQLGRKAEQMALKLKDTERLPVWEAQDSPLVLSGRRFFKQLPKTHDPRIEACRKELLALKLGVSSEVFDHNSGFQDFAEKSHLERYLNEYHQPLLVGPEKKISILQDGRYVSWEAAHDAICRFPKAKESPTLPWVYGPKGVQYEDAYNWSRLKPYKYDDPEKWGRRYVFELAVCCGDNPHKTGDHGWLRLRTPEGEVYSAGLYRPQKRGLSDNWKTPFRIKRGILMGPDLSDFWPDEIRTLRVGITKEQFHTMVQIIEKEKAQDALIFQLFQSNCVLWAAHVAREAGVEIPVGACSVIRLFMPRFLASLLNKVPETVVRVAERITALVVNLFQLMLGAGIVDRDVIAHGGANIRPHIASWREVFDPKKMILHHPSTFGNETIRAVEQWRASERTRLKSDHALAADPALLQRRVDEVSYQLPPASSGSGHETIR
jgi:hypothetical protein